MIHLPLFRKKKEEEIANDELEKELEKIMNLMMEKKKEIKVDKTHPPPPPPPPVVPEKRMDALKRIAKKLAMYSKSLQENYEVMLENFKRGDYNSDFDCYEDQSEEYEEAFNKARGSIARIYGIASRFTNSILFKGFTRLNALFAQIRDIASSLILELQPIGDKSSCYRDPMEYSEKINSLQGLIDTIIDTAGLDLSENILPIDSESESSLLERVNLLEKKIESIENELIPLIKEVHSLLQQYQKSLKKENSTSEDLKSALEELEDL